MSTSHENILNDLGLTPLHVSSTQVCNQLGTPGGAKSFLTGAQIFQTMSNTFFAGRAKSSPPLVTRLVPHWCRISQQTDPALHSFLSSLPGFSFQLFNSFSSHMHSYPHLICAATLISYVQLPSSHMHSYPHLICAATLISYAQLLSSHKRSYPPLICTATLISYAQLPSSHMRSYPHLICAATLISYAQLPSSHMRSYSHLISAATLLS